MLEHGVSDVQDQEPTHMRRIAHAPTALAYKDAVEHFMGSALCNSRPCLQHWFEKKWHPQQGAHVVIFIAVLHNTLYQ